MTESTTIAVDTTVPKTDSSSLDEDFTFPPVTAEDVKAFREASGLSQRAFSKQYGIPIQTVRNWEQGISSPRQGTASLLRRVFEPLVQQTLGVSNKLGGGQKIAISSGRLVGPRP